VPKLDLAVSKFDSAVVKFDYAVVKFAFVVTPKNENQVVRRFEECVSPRVNPRLGYLSLKRLEPGVPVSR
jgi:hypothetical protein